MAENIVSSSEKKVLLSIKDLEVKFRVRSRILTAIRGISLDIYENEAIAIVGESGSGKSVFTKTFAGMLDSNGFISKGEIVFSDEELAATSVRLSAFMKMVVHRIQKRLNNHSALFYGSDIYKEETATIAEKKAKSTIPADVKAEIDAEIDEANYQLVEHINLKQTFDAKNEKDKIRAANVEIAKYKKELKTLKKRKKQIAKDNKIAFRYDVEGRNDYASRISDLKRRYKAAISVKISDDEIKRNEILAKEIYLSVGRYGFFKRISLINRLVRALKKAFRLGVDISDEETLNSIFDTVVFRVKYLNEEENRLNGRCIINLANVRYYKDWSQIRGAKIATVFQDPMTSLNPIITIGKQITSIILKHQNCSEVEARKRAIELMKKVGIPNAENRFDDYPFQYSGGMRQRIVIAIALSCQPKILICDEPTTALDVTIQAQILKLIKDLQKEFKYTIVFITHDLGVVANVADRVAVLYAGQVVEVGTVEEVFYDPRHPYTWALLSSLPQLAQKNTKLFSISGTPPSLYNKIVGDPFAPRNQYCMKIDTLLEPPMFKVTDTHYAKTWLLDPRAPKVEKPEVIQGIHEKLMKAFNI